MKVLHIISSLDEKAGGPSRSVPQTCMALAKLGLQIEIISQPSANPVFIPEIPNLKVTFYSYLELLKFARVLSHNEVDLVHLQHIWTPYISIMAMAARKNGIPFIITPRGMLEPWIIARNQWKKELAMMLYQKKDLNRAVVLHATAKMEEENIRRLGFTNNIAVIPNGIDLSNLPPPITEYGSKKMIFLSRIHQKKGIELLLEAWSEILPVEWTLEIAGDGDQQYIESIIKKIGKLDSKSVKFVGSKYGEEKWNFLKSADIFVLPSFSENFGIVVAEALAVGLPVITTKQTPWDELESRRCGWWIDLSLDNLVASLREAMHSKPDVLNEMGQRGSRLIREKYSIKAVALQVEKMYRNLIRTDL